MLAGKSEVRERRKRGGEEDSRASRERETQAPDFASRGSKRSAANRTPAAKSQPDDLGFDEFWAGYPRKVAKDAAAKAYAAAIKRGATPEALHAGAKRYAGERAGQDPRFTKHATTWLNGGCWSDEPPPTADGPPIIDGVTGELVEVAKPRSHRGPKTWAKVSAELLAEIGGGDDGQCH